MKKFVAAFALLLNFGWAFADSPIIIRHQFQWEDKAQTIILDGKPYEYWTFEEGVASSEFPDLQFFMRRFPVESYGSLNVQVVSARYEPFDKKPTPGDSYLAENLKFETSVERQRRDYFGKVAFAPFVKRSGRFERLVEVELRITLIPRTPVTNRDPNNTRTSALSDGSIYKLGVTRFGLHKLTYGFLKDELGIDIDNIDPREIKLFGNGGGKLPYFVDEERIDDLQENAITIVGEEDGSFDAGDYILFYGEGPDRWSYREDFQQFFMEKNIYDNRNYYFLKISPGPGKRVAMASMPSGSSYTTSSFDDYARLEQEKVNLMHEWDKAQGSGKHWYGDHFKVARQYTYNNAFSFPNLLPSEPITVRASMALRARISSRFFVEINGQSLQSGTASGVNSIGSNEDNTRNYASRANLDDTLFLSLPEASITVSYPYPQNAGDESEGWLDYVQFNVRRALRMSGAQLSFRDRRSLGNPASTFQLDNAVPGALVWDITDPLEPRLVPAERNGQQLSFRASTEELREFVAFDPAQNLLSPEALGAIPNQNIHGIDNVDMVILYFKEIEQEALRLAEHRNSLNGLTIELVDVQQVYNEFASGRTEPTAIRDFARMLYDRSERFRYLLLFGDGSFDTRDIYGLGGDHIPTFQKESFNPVEAYPTDDFYGLLEPEDPQDPLSGSLSIAVGRMPANNMQEAARAVSKIIQYDSEPETMRDWRNRLVFVGDDNDSSLNNFDIDHYKDADRIAETLYDSVPYINLEKIYLDAFPQESTPGGERIPLATEALNKSIFKGALAVTYLGHGGPRGWAQERVLNITDILSWDNFDNMPIFITATCSFTGYDDPSFTSAGEEAFLNGNGGAIALMTTVRAVYAASNARMTENALEYLFKRQNGKVPTIGEAFQRGKNSVSGSFNINNSRKFTLIGDPSMPIAIPNYQVATTKIDGIEVDTMSFDTLQALQKVTIEGVVQDLNGNLLPDFNGIIYPTIFDKAQTVSSLGQGANSVFNYRVQRNVIFKGRASITNGRFEFTCVIPKDINYQYGFGKISYYAADESTLTDAAGNFEGIVIGGTDPNALQDSQGPLVEVFMNTEDFVFGSVTSANPTLIAKISDDNGVNVVGNSIGHDLEGVLNGNTQNTYLLNDFYESDLNDHTRGTARYPLDGLPDGRHRIEVKAWDVANNSAVGYTEFVVASSGEVALERVLNYPNPFTDRTCFQFDHNLSNQEIEVLIQVFTISGRLVKTLQTTMFSDGALRLNDCIEWDGLDDYGDRLARGVYLYKVKVRASNTGNTILSGESEFEKLVILK